MKCLPLLLLLPAMVRAADVYKDNTTASLDTGASWLGGVAPGPADTAVWFSNFTVASPRTAVGADIHWGGLRIDSSASLSASILKPDESGPEVLFTLGSAGISVNSITKGVILGTNMLLGADQTWTVAGGANASGVSFLAPFKEGNEAFVDLGGHTLTKSGAGFVSFTTNTLGDARLYNGTLLVNAGECQISSSANYTSASAPPLMHVPADLTVRVNSGGALRPFNRNSAHENLLWNARVELNGGTMYASGHRMVLDNGESWNSTLGGVIQVLANSIMEIPSALNTLNAEHKVSASFTGSGALALRNHSAITADHRFLLTGDNSAYTGSFVLDGGIGRRAIRLRGNSAGSPAAAWSVNNLNTLEIENSDVQLGSLAGGSTGTLTSAGSGSSRVTIGARNTSTSFPGLVTNAAGTALALRKTGTGTLTLSNTASAWAGDTTVLAGTLALSCLLDDSALVSISSGAVLRSKAGATDTIGILVLDGVLQPAGTYGAPGSGAAHESTSFAGTGLIEVPATPDAYTRWALSHPVLDSGAARAPSADPDGDGLTNLAEFATLSDPASSSANPLVRLVTESSGEITFTLPVATSGPFTLTVEAGSDLMDFSLPVTSVSAPNPPAGFPPLPAGWEYRSWRAPASAVRVFFRAVVTP